MERLKKREGELRKEVHALSKEQTAASMSAIKLKKEELALCGRRIAALKSEQKEAAGLGQSYEAGKQRAVSSALHIGAAVYAAKSVLGKPLKSAMEFESGMLGVVKQVDGLRDAATGKFTEKYYKMVDDAWGLSKELPIDSKHILGMIESSGRMGIQGDQVIPFTRAVGRTSIALDLDPEKTADDLAKLSVIYQIPAEQMEARMADTINHLSDNSPTKAGQLIEILKGIGGTAQFLGMPEKDSVALSSLLMTVSASPEIARTAGNALLRELSVAQTQPARFQSGLKALGLNGKDVQESMAKNPTQTIIDVLERIKAVRPEERMSVTTQLYGKEYGDDIAKVAINVDLLREYLKAAHSDKAQGSVQREFEAKSDSLEYRLQRLNNQLDRLSTNIGTVMVGPVGETVEWIGGFVEDLAVFAKNHPEGMAQTLKVATALFAGSIFVKLASLIYGLGQAAFAAVGMIGKSIDYIGRKKLGEEAIEEGLAGSGSRARGTRSRRAGRWLGRRAGRVGRMMGRIVQGGSLRIWKAGATVLGALSAAWTKAGLAAKGAARGFGSVFRTIASGARLVLGFLRANPLGVALTLMGTAVAMIYQRWSSFQWFWGEMKGAITDIGGAIRDVTSAMSALIEKIGEVSGYQGARDYVSRGIEGLANWWSGETPVRADAPVMTRQQELAAMVPPPPSPPEPPPINQGRAGVVNNDNSSTTINITQRPGEDAEAVARRVTEAQARARAARQRGVMYDPAPAF